MIYSVCTEVFEIQNMRRESPFQESDLPFFEETELLLVHTFRLGVLQICSVNMQFYPIMKERSGNSER